MMPKVFIIILNWNGWRDTLECLKSLRKLNYPNFEILVVDNGSTDDSVERLNFGAAPKFPKFLLLQNEKNLGFVGGNNIGIKYTLEQGTDYVLLLNNDTMVSPDFLQKLVEVGEQDEQFGILGPKIYFWSPAFRQRIGPDSKIWSAGGQVNWLYNKGTMRGYGQIDKGQYDQPSIQETEYLTGCCLLIKRPVIEEIGLMPGDYFLYYEDVDWSLRAQRAGFKCIFVPSAKIWHKGSKSSVEFSPSYIYYHIRNGLILARRFAPWYIQPFVHLDVVWRIFKQVVKLIFLPKRRFWVKPILLGIRDFYLGKRGLSLKDSPSRTVPFIIGIDAHYLEGQPTGVGRYLENLLREWSNFDQGQTLKKFILYFKKEIPADLDLPDSIFQKKILWPGHWSNAFFIHFLLPRAAQKDKVDILFCPGYIAPIFYSGKIALALHDIIYQARPELYNWPSPIDKILLKKVSQISAKKAQIIFVPSEFTKKEVLKHYQIEPAKVFHIPLAVDDSFHPSTNQKQLIRIKKKYQIKDRFILSVGSIFNRRHWPKIIKAFETLLFGSESPKLVNYQFLIIGANHTQPRIDIDGLIQKTNRELGYQAIIRLDYAAGQDLVHLYQAADCFIWLSDYEGFGFANFRSYGLRYTSHYQSSCFYPRGGWLPGTFPWTHSRGQSPGECYFCL